MGLLMELGIPDFIFVFFQPDGIQGLVGLT